ncbi:MAG: urease subunit beta [Actinomycetota bacterium]|nr:urease subunit beta [Actinomycetota bacterium]
MIPGEFLIEDEDVEINLGSEIFELQVVNDGDRPIQVGSHFHFYETNDSLIFDREKSFNCRLAIASGTAIRFEPGQRRVVPLIKFRGSLGQIKGASVG